MVVATPSYSRRPNMDPTKRQRPTTSRMSTGGKAPRKQLAVKLATRRQPALKAKQSKKRNNISSASYEVEAILQHVSYQTT